MPGGGGGGGSPHVPLNPWFFSFFRASLKRCPYAIIVPGCSDKTRGIIKVNARRKLKKTRKKKKKKKKKLKKTEKTEKPRIQGDMPGGGQPPCSPESLVFQFFPVFSSFLSVVFSVFSVFSVSRELP